jgi:predicted dinucleotide-binding enzyme
MRGTSSRVVAGLLVASGCAVTAAVWISSNDSPASLNSAQPATAGSAANITGAATESAVLALPTPSVPGAAQQISDINKIISEVTQLAVQRPKDQRMSAEEIDALITSRIEELKAQQKEEGG